MIYLASDHGGFFLKKQIIEYFKQNNITFEDLGPFEFLDTDDYPEYVIPLAKKVQENPKNKGIVICRNGVGVTIATTRHKNIRTALSWNYKHAKSSRIDDDTNVLALPADYIDEKTAIKIVDTWLHTEFSALPRHIRRIKEVESI